MAAKVASIWGALVSVVRAGQCQWPQVCPGTFPRKQTYLMNKSTIIMPCNESGLTDPAIMSHGWGIIDFDWSNNAGYGTADGWAKHKPMDNDEQNYRQAQLAKQVSPATDVWVYRNAVYGYPWYSSVRRILDDPAYRDWFIPFKPEGPWYSPKCDHDHDPPLCSDLYHNQMQQPVPEVNPPTCCHATCSGRACNCGKVPCGFYVFNHSSTTVVGNQTFQHWFVHSYVLNDVGSSSMINGFFWDDVWNEECDLHDSVPHTCEDMGLTKSDLAQLTEDFNKNMAALIDATLNAGKFAWQMMWTGGDPTAVGETCPTPPVKQATCAADLRALCKPGSPPQTRAMMYSFTGHPSKLPGFEQDLANFLLVRGPYAWLGHGWVGCGAPYIFPQELHGDYGEPLGLCAETAPGSGVFVREWTKASVEMDCNQWKPKVQLKQQSPWEAASPVAFV